MRVQPVRAWVGYVYPLAVRWQVFFVRGDTTFHTQQLTIRSSVVKTGLNLASTFSPF